MSNLSQEDVARGNSVRVYSDNLGARSSYSHYRETQNRASRFNLSQDEMIIYKSFAHILASFDSNARLELMECILKDS